VCVAAIGTILESVADDAIDLCLKLLKLKFFLEILQVIKATLLIVYVIRPLAIFTSEVVHWNGVSLRVLLSNLASFLAFALILWDVNWCEQTDIDLIQRYQALLQILF
jgi:hypothetical protein